MPRKIKRMGENQTLLFVIEEEPSNLEAYIRSDAILPKEWEAPIPKRTYREGSIASKIGKGIWLKCPNCNSEDIEFISDASQAWLRNEKQCICPVCKTMVDLE